MKSNKVSHSLLRFGALAIVVVALALVTFIWWKNGISSFDRSDTEPITFVIARGEGVRDIASKLATQRLIRSPIGFFLLVKFLGLERDLQAGDFRLSRAMDAREIAQELTHGITDIWVTTLEGWRVEEIAGKLVKELDIPESEFLKHAREGYMFPDTYLIPRDATAAAVARLFLATFENKMTPHMREGARATGLSFDEVITLASVVEREGKTDEDRPVIAGILLKRLTASWPLQADATIQYALGYQPFEKSWWKKSISAEDKKIKSPYNTYIHQGMPPAPIANPGLSSINAVISPKDTSFWYYLHDTKGTAHYAETFEEHEKNIATYLQ